MIGGRQSPSPLSAARHCGHRVTFITYYRFSPAAGSTDIYEYVGHSCYTLTCASCPVMAARKSGTEVSISTLRLKCTCLLLSAIACAALLSATGSAEADRVRFQPRLGSDHQESKCLRLYEESKLVWGNVPVDIRGTNPDTERALESQHTVSAMSATRQ